jgi:hypothetical protein
VGLDSTSRLQFETPDGCKRLPLSSFGAGGFDNRDATGARRSGARDDIAPGFRSDIKKIAAGIDRGS